MIPSASCWSTFASSSIRTWITIWLGSPRGSADVEETPCYLLARPDLGKGAVFLRIEVNLERFFVRSEIHLRLHSASRCWTFAGFTTRYHYRRTRSAALAGIQPRSSFGST